MPVMVPPATETARLTRGARGNAGSALIAVMLVSLVCAGVAVLALASIPVTLREAGERYARARARFAADAGQVVATSQLEARRTASISCTGLVPPNGHNYAAPLSAAALAAAPDGTFSVAASALADGSTLLDVSSVSRGVVVRQRRVVKPTPATPFRHALGALTGLAIQGRVFTDSYDSDAGAYVSQATEGTGASRHAHAAGALVSNGPISLQTGEVFGSVAPGHAGTLNPGLAVIHGSTAPLAAALEAGTPDLSGSATGGVGTTSSQQGGGAGAMSAGGTSSGSGSGTLGGTVLDLTSGSLDVPSGTYDLETLRVKGATLVIRGDVTLRVSQSFRVETGGKILVEKSATLRLIAGGDVDIAGLGLENVTGRRERDASGTWVQEGLAAKLSLFVTTPEGDCGPSVRIATTSPLYAAIHAPGRPLRLDADATLFGSVIADSVEGAGAISVHYDEALKDVDVPGFPREYEVVAGW